MKNAKNKSLISLTHLNELIDLMKITSTRSHEEILTDFIFAENPDLFYYLVQNGLGCNLLKLLAKFDLNNLYLDESAECDSLKSKLGKSIEVIESFIKHNGGKIVLIKRYGVLDICPRDIDVFISAELKSDFFKYLVDYGFLNVHFNQVETSFDRDEILRIDIYTQLSYAGHQYLSCDDVIGSSVLGPDTDLLYVPSNEVQFLLVCAHNFISHRRITLLDLIYMQDLFSKVDMTIVRQMATKNGWILSLEIILDELVNIIDRVFSQRECFILPYYIKIPVVLDIIKRTDSYKHSSLNGKFYIYLSLFADDLLHFMKRTWLYGFIYKYKKIRNILTRPFILIRKARGDDTV